MEQQLTRTGKILQRLNVSHAFPARRQKVTPALFYTIVCIVECSVYYYLCMHKKKESLASSQTTETGITMSPSATDGQGRMLLTMKVVFNTTVLINASDKKKWKHFQQGKVTFRKKLIQESNDL